MELMYFVNCFAMTEQERISDPAYLRNFLGLAKK